MFSKIIIYKHKKLLNKIWLLLSIPVITGCGKGTKYSTDPDVIKHGKVTFNTHCASCHDMKLDGIGPKLNGVTKIENYQWLKEFITNPEKLVKAGDERANRLFQRYNTYMPNYEFLKPGDIDAVLSYINSEATEFNVAVDNSEAELVVLPRADAIRDGKLSLVIEDYVKIPSSSEHMPLARIANMRVRPNSPGNEFFVNDQRGYIYKVSGQKKITKFFDIHDYAEPFIDHPGMGTGLGSFAFHPDFEHNGLIYTTHAEDYRGRPGKNFLGDSIPVKMQWVLSEWKMDNPVSDRFVGTQRELLRVNYPTHSHGFQDLSFVPNISKNHPEYGLLYLGIGDGGTVEANMHQLSGSIFYPFGTVIRIDPAGNDSYNGQYGMPETNPFVQEKDKGIWKEIYAYGFRNPHRLAWSTYGNMIVADVGLHSFEELNLVEPGKNYGWYHREGDHQIDLSFLDAALPIDSYGEQYELPLAQYDHYAGSAICGGYQYMGPIEALKNKYIFGDIVNGEIFYTKLPFEKKNLNTIYSMGINYKGKDIKMKEIVDSEKVDMRFGEDAEKNLYIMNKMDAIIRMVKDVNEQ
tara:strand:+ start:8193 stop:9920 length:1728 start_codon:yes stop_codon:yes gene_type:complete